MVLGTRIKDRQVTKREVIMLAFVPQPHDEPVHVVHHHKVKDPDTVAGPQRPTALILVNLGLEGKIEVLLHIRVPGFHQFGLLVRIDPGEHLPD
jgi:hypothetical protein